MRLQKPFSDEEDLEIYTSGATNIFKYPELSRQQKASELISTFEEKDKLTELYRTDFRMMKQASRFISETRLRSRP